MAVYRGHVLVAWGDVERPFRAHSVRKSLVSALVGPLMEEGAIDLDATLADLGIDDATPLTEQERRARVRDLVAARSGVYLPAAYASSGQLDALPERDSHTPGTRWFYNNWDFNVAGVIVERATGEGLYDAFDRRIARPLGMEDYAAEDGFVVYEPSRSRHPAHTFRLSTRDLARFGQLYLQGGRWAGRQVVPAGWVAESTRPITDFGDGTGYGYMWWTYEAGSLGAAYPHLNRHHLYMARGTGGQALYVIPSADLVIVHRGDTDHDREVVGRDVWHVADRILGARTGPPEPEPALQPVEVIPFESRLPAPDPPSLVELPPEAWGAYYGDYEVATGAVARIYAWEGRPFIFFPGEGDAELFPLGEDRFTVQVVSGVDVRFERDAAGAIEALEVRIGSERVRAPKR
jgi:CubicO group peptidase (beta-lactamase class C family)